MDIFTHGLLPYLIGKSLKRNKEEVTAFVLGGIAPDIDFFILWINFVYPTFFLITHRGITHSLFFGSITAIGVLYMASRPGIKSYIRRFIDFEPLINGRTIAFACAGVVLHLFLDYLTTLGIPLLYPLSTSRYSAELFFYTDLSLTILSLILIIWILKKHEHANTAVKFLLIFLVIFTLVGGLRFIEKNRSLGLQGENAAAYPTSDPFDWYIVEENNDHIRIYEFNGSYGSPVYSNSVRKLNIFSNLNPDEAIAVAGKLPQVKMFVWRAYDVAINATYNGDEWSLEYYDPVQRAMGRDIPERFKGFVRSFSSLNVTVTGNKAVAG
jgi:inner membrane protein